MPSAWPGSSIGPARCGGFPLPPNASASELLTHLNPLDHGSPVNAAVLLFGRQPQRFLLSSEVKAAHFHGTAATTQAPAA
jgi:predicted HTH transcriptional regulator